MIISKYNNIYDTFIYDNIQSMQSVGVCDYNPYGLALLLTYRQIIWIHTNDLKALVIDIYYPLGSTVYNRYGYIIDIDI